MRVMHIVKTTEGAPWAVAQVEELVKSGIEVHAVLPGTTGRMTERWRASGAKLHYCDLDFPVRTPWRMRSIQADARRLISKIDPHLIHTHHLGPTMILRGAMRNSGPTRVYQVAGPLHLEHAVYRRWDLFTAAPPDCWVGSSAYIVSLYRRAGVRAERLFTSYHGTTPVSFRTEKTGFLHRALRIPTDQHLVGNISFIYPPKYHVGQFIGLKAHEDLIDALALVVRTRRDVTGVLIGSTWGEAERYERKLRARAKTLGRGRIVMPGYFASADVQRSWADFDCAVHAPISENCGGVVEPLLAGVPTIAGRIGGLTEVVIDGVTGQTVPIRKPRVLAEAIHTSLDNLQACKRLALNGQKLVRTMFDIRRTSREVHAIYQHLLNPACSRPPVFDSREFAEGSLRENLDGIPVEKG